jgi:hypothetical protein
MARGTTRAAARPSETIDNDTGEVLETGRSRALAPVQQAILTFGQGGLADFEIAKYVTVPMLEVPPGVPFIAMLQDKVQLIVDGVPVKSKIKGPHNASTIVAPDGEARLLTWSAVFMSEMTKAYPNDEYVGKWFKITKMQMKAGKDYWTYAIVELRRRGETIEQEDEREAA